MKKINYKEFCLKLEKMQIGYTFDFYEEYNKISGEKSHAYGVGVIRMFDSTMIIINYYGGGMPYIIDMTLPDYGVEHEGLSKYFRESRNGFHQTEFVFVEN